MNIDLIAMLGNLSQSLLPVQELITGGSYLLGVIFCLSGLIKLKKAGQSSAQESMFVPIIYISFGSLLLYFPSALNALTNTVFGDGNVLSYSTSSSVNNFYSSMEIIIRTAGIIWFVRGIVLIIQSSQPGSQEGPKGLAFLFAGVLATNFDITLSALNWMLNHLIDWSTSPK